MPERNGISSRLFLGRTCIGTCLAPLPATFHFFCDACGREWGAAVPPEPMEHRFYVRRCVEHHSPELFWQTGGSFLLAGWITPQNLDRDALLYELNLGEKHGNETERTES